MSYILGISAYYHDAAAALIKDGEIIAAAQEERFTRIKNDASFPANAIRYCLQQAGILLCDISTIIYYEKPYLKFERILEIFYRYAPWGVEQFIKGIPIWIEEKLFCKRMLKRELRKLGKFDETFVLGTSFVTCGFRIFRFRFSRSCDYNSRRCRRMEYTIYRSWESQSNSINKRNAIS